MAELRFRVELTASFLERLAAIETFLEEADAAVALDKLLVELRTTIIPNLGRFPRVGRRYLDQPPQSAEALAQLAALPSGVADALREYVHGDYLILYALDVPNGIAYLLSVRHHRELSFQFARLWAGGVGTDER